jgi:hypothetical protein
VLPDLSYYTSTELVEELAKRQTFVGVIIHSQSESKGQPITIHENWEITYSKLSAEQTYELMLNCTEHFKEIAGIE